MKLRMLVRGTAYVATFCVLSAFLPLSNASGSASASGLDGPATSATTAYTAPGFQPARRTQLSPTAAADSTLTYYGPPYFQYGYSNFGPWSTVGAAINAWWIDYQGRWPSAFPGCSYTVELLNPNMTNNNDHLIGEVAQMPLHGTCGGWGRVLATAYPYKPGKNNGKPCNCVGDPINFGTGNEYRDDQDLSLSWLSLHRYYNSHASVALSHIGAQWRHSFDRSLEYLHDSVNGVVTVYRQDGRQVVFTLSSGQWVADPDIADTLTPVSDASGNLSGWVFIDASTREQESYDVAGHLLAITDVNKQRVLLAYSDATTPVAVAPSAGLLLKVTDPLGRQLSFTYDNQARVASITQPDGGVLAYTYGANGTLARVTYPDTSYRQYIYNESSLTSGANLPTALTGEVDENGTRLIDIGYDPQGRAILSRSAGTVDVTQVSYGPSANTVTYPSGIQVTYGLSTVNGFVRASTASGPCGPMCGQPYATSTFDTNGYPYTGTDFNGHITQTTYSAQGLLTSRIEALNEGAQRTTSTTWDTANRVPLTRSVADADGSIRARSAWVYNNRAQVVARCDIDPAVTGYTCATTGAVPGGVSRTTYTYCDAVDNAQCPLVGLLLSVTGPRTDAVSTTHYSYYLNTDESGCGVPGGTCHRMGDAYQITDAAGHITTYVAYDKNGRLVRQRDANGILTDFTYQPRGWLLTRTVRANADGTPSANDAVTQIAYKPYGAVESITDPDGVKVTYTYDPAHRLTDITDALGNRIHYTLDAAGNKTKEETFDTSGTLRRSLGRTYNTLGQLTGIKDGLNRTVFDASFSDSYDGNGNLVRSADALGIQRKQGYDALNRLITTIDNYNGTDPATQNTQSVFAYDARDQLQGVSDPDGLNTTYDYDGLGNTTAVHSPDTGTSTYVYDAAGNRTQATDARGVISNSTYDALNRITATTYPHSDANVSYRYDEPDTVTGCVGSYPVGRLTSIVETAVTTVYCYDARGNVVKKSQTQGTNVDTVSYTYTLADRLASTRTPDGTSIQYARDGAGRISAVTVLPPGTSGPGASNVVTNVSYLPFGPIASYTLGNGQTITRTYDANYAVTDVVSPALNLHFARDATGNITALGNAPGANPAIETYSYDPLYRLTGLKDAQGQAIEAYTYNKTGDRLSKTGNGLATGTYGYQAGTHWLTSIGNSARTYDANGNTTGSASGGDNFGYGYNDRNRMAVVQRNGQTVGSYTYNALGQRVAKVATASQRFAYDEGSQLLGEYGATSRNYIWLDKVPVATLDAGGSNGAVSYVHADGIGTPRVITSGTGAAVWQWSYQANPFGEQAAPGDLAYNLRFPGQYYDIESMLHYNVNRDYEAAIGRYVQSDPIGLGGGANTYAYAGGNPASNSDALGLYCRSAGGSTYCSFPGGPSFLVPTPSGFQDFSNNDSYYHAYDVTRPIGDADPDCVMKQLIDNSVPNNPSGGVRPASPEGTPNIAYIPIIGTDNQVISYVAKNLSGPGLVAVNMTGSGSTFSPGYVARTVSGGVAHTYGEGTSPIQSNLNQDQWGPIPLGALNNLINERVWGRQMDEFISKARKGCGCGY